MSSLDNIPLGTCTIGLQQQKLSIGTGEYCCNDGSLNRDHSHLTSVDDKVSISDILVLKIITRIYQKYISIME